jgi:puromycin-sensitive aminopeptidase
VAEDAVIEHSTDRYRLPRTVTPRHYDLTLEPDLAAATFAGHAAVQVEVHEATDRIVLNAIELDVAQASLEGPDGTVVEASDIDLDEERERLTVVFPSPIGPGPATLRTTFTGILNDKLHGFYRSTFTDTDGAEQVLATTQFEATDARRAFPCWDEPDRKATFGITLVVDDDLFAVSNAREVARRPAEGRPGKVSVSFADTMKMSTYLVAFAVGPLEATDPVDVDGKPLRVVYPKGKGHLTAYALEVGQFCLEYFRDYYGIVYPGDKLDLLAIPDFAFGAMENLGCVTFREVLVLVEPDEVTQPELQRVTDVIAHELAHMWFGDLVTMKWWNGIWLNEAFATFMEMMATDAFRPEWDRWTDFGLSRTEAFDVDSLLSTRPIEYPVVSPEDAEGMFDVLTYEKGAAVVRMLEQYVGPEAFRDGIRLYLSRHQYGNTETTDLWDALEEATGEPVRRIMDAWIFQGGYPVIEVEVDHNDLVAGEAGVLAFHQERFTFADDIGDGNERKAVEEADRRWPIPLIFSFKSEGVVNFEKVLLEGERTEVALLEPAEWVLVNTEGTGFYRANYHPDLLDALRVHAQADLSAIERYDLVDGAWAAVAAGRLSTPDHLTLVEGFGDEEDVAVWGRIIGTLGFLDRLVDGDARTALQYRIRTLLRPALDRLGPEPADGEADRRRELRGTLFEALGLLGVDPDTQDRARQLLDQWESGNRPPVDPSLFAGAVAIVASASDPADFDRYVAHFEAAATPQDEVRFLNALSLFDHPSTIAQVCELSMTDRMRTQNAPFVIGRAVTARDHGPDAWSFIQRRWDDINERFPSNSIARMLGGIRSLHRPEVADTVFSFFTDHEVPQGEKTLAQHLERLQVNVALRAREATRLAHHLTHHPT